VAEHGAEVQIKAPIKGRFAEVVTHEAIKFLAELHCKFDARRKELLAARIERQSRLDAGEQPEFLPETKHIREAEWAAAALPKDLLDRRVEITGPVDCKTIINALNSGARVFVSDFEDSTTPTWENLIEGQINLYDAIRRTITFEDENTGRSYRLEDETAVLFVRPRGWHMVERHLLIDGEPISASIFDFGLYLFHNAKELSTRGTRPYFYLPKIEGHLEARLWNEIFKEAEQQLGLLAGSIKATVLIETILAAFEMEEILWELRDYSAGLNCGRWDYIFSLIKKFAADEKIILPDRAQVTMTTHFLRTFSNLCIRTCHRRGVSSIGSMSLLVPVKNDPEANERALANLRSDMEREVADGHDGTSVTHPDLVPVAIEVFNRSMLYPNQIARQLDDFDATAADLLRIPAGNITEIGLRRNVAVGLGYLEAWLRGIGCVALFNTIENAATAEISRAQLWQWIHHNAKLDDGRAVTLDLVESSIVDELNRVKAVVGMEQYRAYRRAAELLREMLQATNFTEFLTLAAYPRVLEREHYPVYL
jgi:malate synthase